MEFYDGTVALRWRVTPASSAFYASIAHVVSIHGHEGRTTVQWLDPEGNATPPPPTPHLPQ